MTMEKKRNEKRSINSKVSSLLLRCISFFLLLIRSWRRWWWWWCFSPLVLPLIPPFYFSGFVCISLFLLTISRFFPDFSLCPTTSDHRNCCCCIRQESIRSIKSREREGRVREQSPKVSVAYYSCGTSCRVRHLLLLSVSVIDSSEHWSFRTRLIDILSCILLSLLPSIFSGCQSTLLLWSNIIRL